MGKHQFRNLLVYTVNHTTCRLPHNIYISSNYILAVWLRRRGLITTATATVPVGCNSCIRLVVAGLSSAISEGLISGRLISGRLISGRWTSTATASVPVGYHRGPGPSATSCRGAVANRQRDRETKRSKSKDKHKHMER